MKDFIILLVSAPSIEELKSKDLNLGFSGGMDLLEAYAFLQQILAGLWEIMPDRGIQKRILETASWSTAGQAYWVDLAVVPPLEAAVIRLHCEKVKNNDPCTLISRPVYSFDLKRYPPESGFSKLEIGAVKNEDGIQLVFNLV